MGTPLIPLMSLRLIGWVTSGDVENFCPLLMCSYSCEFLKDLRFGISERNGMTYFALFVHLSHFGVPQISSLP